MAVLICCERSQIFCNAFRQLGIEAFSNDILPSYGDFPEYHIQGDAIDVLYSQSWDLVIAHPPCTYLSKAGARWFNSDPCRYDKMQLAAEFFYKFVSYGLSGHRIAIENPVPLHIAGLPFYDQKVQPYYFGDPFQKTTCLWLYNLPLLMPTCILSEYSPWIAQHGHSACDDISGLSRQDARSRSFPGMASAAASQWSQFCGGYYGKTRL